MKARTEINKIENQKQKWIKFNVYILKDKLVIKDTKKLKKITKLWSERRNITTDNTITERVIKTLYQQLCMHAGMCHVSLCLCIPEDIGCLTQSLSTIVLWV